MGTVLKTPSSSQVQVYLQKGIGQVYQKKDIGDDEKGRKTQAAIAYASRISNNNLDFIATLDVESAGSWSVDAENRKNKKGRGIDKGICQFNTNHFSHIINDPNFKNPEWQIQKCYELYSGWEARGIIGKRFFGWNARQKNKKNFYLVTLNQ